jgi:hypothetical protein
MNSVLCKFDSKIGDKFKSDTRNALTEVDEGNSGRFFSLLSFLPNGVKLPSSLIMF